MKNSLLIIGIILGSFLEQTQGQTSEFKYEGLLWEISGNGLEKPSFLYGTMHVSRKIAFNLDDVFFESLEKSDMVAVESMPDNWLDHLFEDGRVGYGSSMVAESDYGYGYSGQNFYSSAFRMKFPSKMDIVRSMFGQYQLINGLFYRSEGSVDFEEDTYLDMFIYQTGKRFNKPTYSLEDYKESRDLVEKAFKDSRKKEIDEWLKNIMDKKNVRNFDILQDAYRDRNIGRIDSINRALYTNNYMENMLFKRNENMVDSMETLMRKGSLFTGVGAAHLPGDKGMIDMLRKRGYILKPLFSDQTEKGKTLKAKFEDKVIDRKYTPQTTEDGFITMDCPNKLYEMYADGGSIGISPDYDNGSYVTITRLYTYNLLRKPTEQLNENDLEKILFEFIPGEILSKEVIKEPYPGFDIKNITKTGNHQRYKFFVTPLEIIIIKMDGKKEFVKNKSDNIYSTIKFSSSNAEKRKVKSYYEGFELEMPNYTIVNNTKYKGKRFVQGYDTESKNYAFLVETGLNDVNYMEEDSFELHYMMEQFCENLEAELDSEARYVVKNNVPALYAYTVLDSAKNTRLNLSTQLIGDRFYLLGYLGNEGQAKDFFNSVKVNSFDVYPQGFKEQIDTNLFYIVRAPEKNPMADMSGSPYFSKKNNEKQYVGYNKNQIYGINSNEQISIQFDKFHDWTVYENIDSLWQGKRERMKSQGFKLADERIYQKDSFFFYEGLAIKDYSQRAVKFKYIQKNGSLYLLKSLIHQNMPLSPFMDTFYQTFMPMDTAIGVSPLVDKSHLFLEAIEKQDSILLNSSTFVKFETKDFEAVKKLFLEKEFDKDWVFLKDLLLGEICEMDYNTVAPFLEKLYLDSYENSNYQIRILSTLLQHQSKASYAKAMKLMKEDLPISDDGSSFLWQLKDSTELSAPFIAQLLELYGIGVYKFDVLGVLAHMVKYDNLSPKKYASLKKQLFNESKIELKRAIGKQKQTVQKDYYEYYGQPLAENKILNKYVDLLYPFRKESKISDFLDKVIQLDEPNIQLNIIELQLINKEKIDKAIIQKLAEDTECHYRIYQILNKHKALDLMADSLSSEVALAKTFLSKPPYYGEKIDTIYHLKSEEVVISGVKQKVHFFVEKAIANENYYNDDKKDVTSIIALTWKPNEKIASDNYYDIKEVVAEDKTEEKVIKELTKQLQLRDRKRVNNNNTYHYEEDDGEF
jgi:uncharacterized protein YbaP (TraB family)